jgi:hypothetical protein
VRALACGITIAVVIGRTAVAGQQAGEQFTRPFGLQLVFATVQDAQHRLGPAKVTVSGHYEETVCYVDMPSRTFVAFMAQGEGLSGRFTARRLREKVPEACSRLPTWALAQLEGNVGGLRLGMSRQRFVAVAGKTPRLVDGFETVTFERSEMLERKAGQAEAAILFTTIVVRGRFEEGGLVEYVVWKTAST